MRRFLSTNLPNDGLNIHHFIPGAAPSSLLVKNNRLPKPDWLRVEKRHKTPQFEKLQSSLRDLKLNTVCEEAKCPNIGECWGGAKGTATATVMVLGDTCTRGCRFCAVKTSRKPPPPDPNEPAHVSQAIRKWGLDYVVLTMVDRDDLPDGGAAHIAETIQLLKAPREDLKSLPPTVEALVGDFWGQLERVETVARSGLDVFAHNIETVEELQPYVRDRRANFQQSLSVLRHAKQTVPSLVTKSSIMVGVGETDDQMSRAMDALRQVGVEVLTIGQYMQPTKKHMKVAEYVSLDKFEKWREEGEKKGFLHVASGPFVRSSYRAGEVFLKALLQSRRSS